MHDDTFEGCGLAGCRRARPTDGTVVAGDSCSTGLECAPTLCACPDGTTQWFGASCACGACGDEMVACDQTMGFACP